MDWFTMTYMLIGGLGMFLFGMSLLSQGLQSMGSGMIKNAINYITANRVFALLVGMLVTAFVQSSSVSTVMMSGFVNAGLMTLTQGVGFIFGANIGTTITGWIISLNVAQYGPLMIGVGVIPMLFAKGSRMKSLGRMILALGMIFYGLVMMGDAFKPLCDYEPFLNIMKHFAANNPLSVLACMGIGCLLTMLIQSSSAMLGITMALAINGAIEFPTAAALVLGENIGTTVTLWLASLSGGRLAKQTALAHTSFNVTGCIIIFFIFPHYLKLINYLVPGLPIGQNIAPHIAMVHTVFNVSMAIILLPFLQYLVRFVEYVIPIKREDPATGSLEFFANIQNLSPVMAIKQTQLIVEHLQEIVAESMALAGETLLSSHPEPEKIHRISEIEKQADDIQKEIMIYLNKVLQCEPAPEETKTALHLIRASDELESISDYCIRLVRQRERLDENQITFNPQTKAMLSDLWGRIERFFSSSRNWIMNPAGINMEEETMVHNSISVHEEEIRDAHLAMIKDQEYPPLFMLTFSDIMVAVRRVKNHTLELAKAESKDGIPNALLLFSSSKT